MRQRMRVFILFLTAVLFAGLPLSGCLGDGMVSTISGQVANTTPTLAPSPSPKSPTPIATATPTTTPTPDPTAEPTPSASPTPIPTPTPDMLDGAPVLLRYDTKWPEHVEFKLLYDNYKTYPNYFVALTGANIREKPTTNSPVISGLGYGQRLELSASVMVGSKIWYRVHWMQKEEKKTGYMHQITGSPREFQIDKMISRAQLLKESLDSGAAVYIRNYKNAKGSAPRLPSGKSIDVYGYRQYQSAPGYDMPDRKSTFRYIPDGMLGVVEDQVHAYMKVYFPTFDQSLWVPNKYLSRGEDAVKELTQVIVVDRKNQNSGVLYWEDGGWRIGSLSYVSTGKSGQYSLPTPLGDYMAQQKRYKFEYYKDGTYDIAGYAPYTIRFSGGGYLHGVPRSYRTDENGQRIDPGHAESLSSLGTTPKSHMCVRNYTSQAKFLYNWVKIGKCAVIVIE